MDPQNAALNGIIFLLSERSAPCPGGMIPKTRAAS